MKSLRIENYNTVYKIGNVTCPISVHPVRETDVRSPPSYYSRTEATNSQTYSNTYGASAVRVPLKASFIKVDQPLLSSYSF